MTAGAVRRFVMAAVCVVALVAPAAACAKDPATESTDCIKVVDESGDATDECLPIAPDSARVDLATPTFSKPNLDHKPAASDKRCRADDLRRSSGQQAVSHRGDPDARYQADPVA